MNTPLLTETQSARVGNAMERALEWQTVHGNALGVAIIRYHTGSGSQAEILAALADYQNEDGGFGKGLEADISSPVSNPFATRLALSTLDLVSPVPDSPMIDGLRTWLRDAQDPDGDWHFAPQVRQAEIAPWFAGWVFPSLNPACCLVGLSNALGLLEEETMARTAGLFAEKASLDEARTGDFYTLLPYVEYFRSVDHPQRDAYLDAIAENITNTAANNGYPDASHFFDHLLGPGPDLQQRIDPALIGTYAERLLDEQDPGGKWPGPYNTRWEPFTTAGSVSTLATLIGNRKQ